MNSESRLVQEAVDVFREIFGRFRDLRVGPHLGGTPKDRGYDIAIDVASGKSKHVFFVEVKSRISPQTAIPVAEQVSRAIGRGIPVVYSPVISARVAEILRGEGVGYVDRAGNCWLQSPRGPMLIERHGFQAEREPASPSADPFSTRSSRIVRALLSQSGHEWKVRELAQHPDVGVSPGLVVKVKRSLVSEAYAAERGKRLCLRDPIGLLEAWTRHYPGPDEQLRLYFRQGTNEAEEAATNWFRAKGVTCTLAGFSAAWRLAPEVRYGVGTIYVDDPAWVSGLIPSMLDELGAKRVESGHNLVIWRPFDRSVFASGREIGPRHIPVTSPLQTYLDLTKSAARGEEAAKAIFDRYLATDLLAVQQRERERRSDAV